MSSAQKKNWTPCGDLNFRLKAYYILDTNETTQRKDGYCDVTLRNGVDPLFEALLIASDLKLLLSTIK